MVHVVIRFKKNMGLTQENREELEGVLQNIFSGKKRTQDAEDFLPSSLPEHDQVAEGQGDTKPAAHEGRFRSK
jgi:hypothetical protein